MRDEGGGSGGQGAKRYVTWCKEQMGGVDGVRVKVWRGGRMNCEAKRDVN